MRTHHTPALLIALLAATTMTHAAEQDPKDAPKPFRKLAPVPFTRVEIADAFWAPRIETNRATTVPHDFEMCEKTGRIDNFAIAGGLKEGKFRGLLYDDSDVYKVIEGASYSLATHPDPKLDQYLDDLIAKIAAAQRPDGYINTYYTLVEPDRRYKDLFKSHELYCGGHMIEAAVAHHRATGKRSLLDVALKFADHVDSVFGPDKRHDVDGHEEIELALFKLADLVAENDDDAARARRYRDLAIFFVAEHGHDGCGRKLYGDYAQDHVPATQLKEVVGHAVRMGYYLCAMTDVAGATGDKKYIDAVELLYDDLVGKKMYVTGGIGARHAGEAFGDAYELPNETAYAETCAAIANALWNHRMNLLHGDAKYADTLERVLYNGFLSGVSLQGDKFFYVNPLASAGGHHRQEWYSTACCPVNVVRFLPSLPGYVYATTDEGVYVNLYAAGEAKVAVKGQEVTIRQRTNYPWDGRVTLTVQPQRPGPFSMYLRVPGWCDPRAVTLRVNGERIRDIVIGDNGYLPVRVVWKPGDKIDLDLPMPVKRLKSDPRVAANVGRVALQRGPVVHCLEAVDNGGRVSHLSLPVDAEFTTEHRPDLLGGVTVIRGKALAHTEVERGKVEGKPVDFTAVPYHAWDHREPGEMAVWLPEDPKLAAAVPQPTLANTSKPSASHTWERDTVAALNDGREPKDSNDHGIPRFTWWDHRGTEEWVAYEFSGPFARTKVSGVEVYWFDDEPAGGACRVPESWTLEYKDAAGQWSPVANRSGYGVEKDKYNAVKFDAVEATGLRIKVKLRKGVSGGILEWRVGEG